jgi:curved DNA-binding protein
MRLAGQGGPGVGNGKAGDLLLELHFNPNPQFRVDGSNLYRKLSVTPWEAALGAIIPISNFGSELKVRIPADTQSGQQLRLRGKGIPSKIPGDLILDIQLVLPSSTSPKAREIYEHMASELAFDPRATDRR